jgi:peptidoglycan hydrolase-like protein with peptidoglycan-binding domain
MRRAALAALAAAALACGGVRRVEPAAAPARAKPEAPDQPAEKGVPPAPGRPRVPAAPEALLAPGAIGKIQRQLERKGYLGAHRRGELDDPTSAALARFQEDEGLAATGMPDRETVARLGLDPQAAYGRDGEEEARRAR